MAFIYLFIKIILILLFIKKENLRFVYIIEKKMRKVLYVFIFIFRFLSVYFGNRDLLLVCDGHKRKNRVKAERIEKF